VPQTAQKDGESGLKKEKIYEFPIDSALTPAKRKIVEKHIAGISPLSDKPVSYEWDEGEGTVLRVKVDPVLFEVHFQLEIVELYGAAPLWARVLFTKKKKAELQEHVEGILHQAKFILPKKLAKKPAKAKVKS
jgi:hypothetical protein